MKLIRFAAAVMTAVLIVCTASSCGKSSSSNTDTTDIELKTRGTQVSGAVEKPKFVSVGKNGSRTNDKLGFQFEAPENGEEIAVLTIKDMGKIRIRLFPDSAPIAVANFKSLIKSGYYDGIIFHRVIADFMIQGGDPNGTGTGGQSAWGVDFEDEFNSNLLNFRGSLSLANSGKNTNGSQFFINTATKNQVTKDYIKNIYSQYIQTREQYEEQLKSQYGDKWEDVLISNLQVAVLDPEKVSDDVIKMYDEKGGNLNLDGAFSAYNKGHTVFGQVFAEDMALADKISKVETDDNDKPTKNVVIEKAEIVKYSK